MWSYSHLMWVLASGYFQLMWSRKTDVIGSCDLCSRAATARVSRRKLVMDTLKQDPNYDMALRLMRGLCQYNKRAAELEEFGIDLYKLAPITELMQICVFVVNATEPLFKLTHLSAIFISDKLILNFA